MTTAEKLMQKGELLNSREVIKKLLKKRFDKVPRRMVNKINKNEDIDILDNLFNEAIEVKSLNEFDLTMTKALNN